MSKSIRKMRGIQIWHPYHHFHHAYYFLQHIFGTCLIKKSFLALKKWKMIFIKIIWKLFLPKMFAIPRHTYVSNMGTLSQTMARGWSYLGHLTRNLYMFIDDWPFCEKVLWKFCQNSILSFSLATSTHIRSPCQRICFFGYFFTFFYFFEKMVKIDQWHNLLQKVICMMKKMIWMSYLDSSHFSNQFRHFIC